MDLVLFVLLLFVWGVIVGGLARFALPGPDPMSIWRTAVLGILGAVLGGIVGRALFETTGGFLLGLICAVILLALYRRFAQRRSLTGRPL